MYQYINCGFWLEVMELLEILIFFYVFLFVFKFCFLILLNHSLWHSNFSSANLFLYEDEYHLYRKKMEPTKYATKPRNGQNIVTQLIRILLGHLGGPVS